MTLRRRTALRIGSMMVVFATATLGLGPPAHAVTPPSNDRVADAMPITAFPTVITQNTQGATRSSTDPACVGAASVWYSFTPRTAMTARFVTVGTAYDAILAVFRGTASDAHRVACGDDQIGLQAGAQVRLLAGTRYLIAVSSYSGMTGTTFLRLYAPATLHVTDVAVPSAVSGQVSGRLFLTGTIRCSNPSIGFISVAASQLVGPGVARSTAEGGIFTCLNMTIRWRAKLDTETGYAFRPGTAAAVTVYAGASDGWQGVNLTVPTYPVITAGPGV